MATGGVDQRLRETPACLEGLLEGVIIRWRGDCLSTVFERGSGRWDWLPATTVGGSRTGCGLGSSRCCLRARRIPGLSPPAGACSRRENAIGLSRGRAARGTRSTRRGTVTARQLTAVSAKRGPAVLSGSGPQSSQVTPGGTDGFRPERAINSGAVEGAGRRERDADERAQRGGQRKRDRSQSKPRPGR